MLGLVLAPLVALSLVLAGCTGERILPAPGPARHRAATIPGYELGEQLLELVESSASPPRYS